ncbi:hypothetical protein [Paraburkholderia lacunae]|uniref:hypothetical protein n=1 Tax=Paraburkholderia lacunae TaxID=2211104 RepID=UPI00140243E2|nr:hypothetical protein [Paraburkholderia lacunae]
MKDPVVAVQIFDHKNVGLHGLNPDMNARTLTRNLALTVLGGVEQFERDHQCTDRRIEP